MFAGSVVALKGNAGQCVYSASKAGLEGFTRSLAKEVASRNIRVNLLAPGWYDAFPVSAHQSSSFCFLSCFCHPVFFFTVSLVSFLASRFRPY